MASVYKCFVSQHDMVLVGLAVCICMLATFSAISLFAHVGQSQGRMRAVWIGVAALAGGVGIWAAHFVATLAFDPGVASGYRLGLTTASLAVAVLFTGAGFAIALRSPREPTALLGGAVLGLGILATYYSGMAGYEVAGHLTWDRGAIVLSSIFAIFLASVALWVVRWRWRNHQALSALILSAGICAHHFIVMGGVTVHPDPLVLVSVSAISARLLAVPVAMASILALAVSMLGLVADIRSKARALAEADRMRTLADAAVEGLVICDRDAIVTINTSFAALTGFTPADLVGQPLSRCIPDRIALQRLVEHPNRIFESELDTRSDGFVPVELIMHGIDFAGKIHSAIAVRDIRSRKLAEERIRFLAHHDVLTGLPNRGWFNTRLDEAIEKAEADRASFTVLCLDLDRFKEVNDLFGHPAGDEVLRAMGRVLSNLLTGPQVVARLGGDEFAVLVPDIGDAVGAGRLADTILRAASEQSALAGSGPNIGTSIGIAIYPGDGVDRQNLLSAADTALYRAKSEGRGSYCFYESSMGAQVRDRRRLEHDLRSAIPRGEMNLVYQPQVSLETGEMVGFEALLRWSHAERGVVSPALFIPIAEESGAILQIGEWVTRVACAEAAAWINPLRVAVNVSAVQLHAPGFAKFVEDVLAETGLDPQRLELEVTETALIRDLNRALATLRRLKGIGVKIAMDDFGTGYSSLSNLRAFPFDRIKIDGSFIQSVDSNEQAAAIVRAILELGRGLQLPILAEGVETPAELGFLGAELCQEVQGYWLGRPATIDTFASETQRDITVGGGMASAAA